MNKNEEKVKAMDDVQKEQISSNKSDENQILTNEDAENLEGGKNGIDSAQAPSESVFGVIVCCG